MIEKGKISQYQLFAMVVLFVFGSTTILRSINIAGRDSWISGILALFAGIFLVLVIVSLSKRCPGMTIIEYSQVILGRTLGKIVGALYIWYFFHLGALVLRNYGELLTSAIMPETPLWFFHLTLALLASYLVYHQLEVLGRVSELFFPLTVAISFATTIFLLISGLPKVENLLPLMERPISDIIKGAVPMASFPYWELIVFTMILPYLNLQASGKKVLTCGLCFGWLLLFMIMVEDIAVFGEYMATLTFPRYYAIRLIAVGDFIERIEPLVLGIWLLAGLVKVGICMFGFVLGLAQLTGMKDYRSLAIPAGVLMAILADISYSNVFEMLSFAVNIYPVYAFPMQIGIPVVLLVVSIVRKKKLKKNAPSKANPASFRRISNKGEQNGY